MQTHTSSSYTRAWTTESAVEMVRLDCAAYVSRLIPSLAMSPSYRQGSVAPVSKSMSQKMRGPVASGAVVPGRLVLGCGMVGVRGVVTMAAVERRRGLGPGAFELRWVLLAAVVRKGDTFSRATVALRRRKPIWMR